MIDKELVGRIEEASAEVQRIGKEYAAQREKTLDTADRLIYAYMHYVTLMADAIHEIAENETEKTPI